MKRVVTEGVPSGRVPATCHGDPDTTPLPTPQNPAAALTGTAQQLAEDLKVGGLLTSKGEQHSSTGTTLLYWNTPPVTAHALPEEPPMSATPLAPAHDATPSVPDHSPDDGGDDTAWRLGSNGEWPVVAGDYSPREVERDD